jgi:D-alanyl-D-alanine carboxypeptidase (penicillin-binding protein 5/6)
MEKVKRVTLLQGLILLWSTALTPLSWAVIPAPPNIEAKAYTLIDVNSQQVLASHNAEQHLDPASLTKMLSVYVVDQELRHGHIQPDDLVHISEKAWRAEGSRMFVKVNSHVKVSELVKGIIIHSGNDATIALAEHIAGSETAFVSLMNDYAEKLGMQHSHFTNATGLPDPEHYTTAADLALLATAVIQEFPSSYQLYSQKWFTYNEIKQPNRNRLLWRAAYVDGIKTGHSSSAGFCLVASGSQNGMRLASVVLGAESDNSRTEQSQKLLQYGFRFFETHHLYQARSPLKETKVWMGKSKHLALGLQQNLYITIPHGSYPQLKAGIVLDPIVKAPIALDQTYGSLQIKLHDTLVAERPLVALTPIETGGMFHRFSDYIGLRLHHLFKPTKA